MEALRKWAEGRPKIVAMLAQVVAVTTTACHNWLQEIRKEWPWSWVDPKQSTKPKDWVAYYRHPTKLRAWLFEFYDLFGQERAPRNRHLEYLAARRDFLEEVRTKTATLWKQPDQAAAVIAEAEENVKRFYQEVFLPILAEMLRDEGPLPEGCESWIHRPETMFFIGVAMPCWLEHRVPAWTLYRRACNGDYNSLEALLRVDPSAAGDERIAGRLFEMRIRNERQHDSLMAAIAQRRDKVKDLTNLKYSLAGWLMRFSGELEQLTSGELMRTEMERSLGNKMNPEVRRRLKQARKRAKRRKCGYALSGADIKSLFDAVAQDMGLGKDDPAFRGARDTVEKRIRRNAKGWPILWNSDKSCAA